MFKTLILVFLVFGIFFGGLGMAIKADNARLEEKKRLQDITVMQNTWQEFKLELVEKIMNSERTLEQKMVAVEEIMRIPVPEYVK